MMRSCGSRPTASRGLSSRFRITSTRTYVIGYMESRRRTPSCRRQKYTLQPGFSDQSHFTNYFSRFIGLTPGAYREIFLHRAD